MASVADGSLTKLGFIGVGAMGGQMVRTVLRAGYSLAAFDIDPERLAACVEAGAVGCGSSAEVVGRSDVVLTSLRSSAIFVEVARQALVPSARAGQVFIDLGTTEPPETRRLAGAFAAKGATLLDVPVSGGPGGSASGTLRMFVGGERDVAERVWPILEALGEPERVVYCGPSGCGQVMKGVNQLAMGLADAAYMEAIAYGVRDGLDPEAIRKVVGGEGGWRGHFGGLARRVRDGEGERLVVKFPELPYYLREAREQGMEMPLTTALFEFCSQGDIIFFDNMRRPTASFWRELMRSVPRDA